MKERGELYVIGHPDAPAGTFFIGTTPNTMKDNKLNMEDCECVYAGDCSAGDELFGIGVMLRELAKSNVFLAVNEDDMTTFDTERTT